MVELTSYLLHLNSVYWGEIKLFENKTTTYCSVKIYVVTIWPATLKDIYTKSSNNLDLPSVCLSVFSICGMMGTKLYYTGCLTLSEGIVNGVATMSQDRKSWHILL